MLQQIIVLLLEAKSANYSTHYFTYQDFRKNELQTTSVPSLVVNLVLFFEFMAKVKKHNKPQPFSIPIRNNESFQIRNCMDWTCIKWHQKLERSKYWFKKKIFLLDFISDISCACWGMNSCNTSFESFVYLELIAYEFWFIFKY